MMCKCGLIVYSRGLCRKHYNQDRYTKDKEAIIARTLIWQKANPEKVKAKKARYRAKPESKEKERQYYQAYVAKNSGKLREKWSNRKRAVSQATPTWVQTEALYAIYENRPAGYHVDHIVPLKGKTVCGLHVPWNLQYLPAVENLKKGNKLV